MANSIPNIVVTPNTIIDLYADPGVVAAGIVVGDLINITMQGTGNAQFYSGAMPPAKIDGDSGYRDIKSTERILNEKGDDGAFLYSLLGCTVNVNLAGIATPPDGLYSGKRAMTVQSYTEANSKLGVEHEGSTYIANFAAAAENDTIFLTGSLPVILKARTVSYTGTGVCAYVFEAPTYTGGVDTPYQNASAINPVTGLSKILVGSTVTVDGVMIFAPVCFIGNLSNQGQGATGAAVGGERILKPNTAYLLRLTSLDSAAQDITSFLSWYEGELDLPL